MGKHEVSSDIMQSRQAWFWRRITLQFALIGLMIMLGYSVFVTASLHNDWQTVAVQEGLIAAVIWLVTIYFASVNDAAKIANVIGSIGHAVGDARDGVPTPDRDAAVRAAVTANIAG